MTHEQERKKHFDPANYPALQEFLPAYLHEDFGEEYATAAETFAGLVSDASGDQISKVKEEWHSLRVTFRDHPLQNMQRALAELGAAWQPQSEHELQAIDEVLNRAEM